MGVLFAIAIGALLAWFLMRRSQKKKQAADAAGAEAGASAPGGYGYPSPVKELSTQVHEYNKYTGAVQVVGELPAAHQHHFAELPVDGAGHQGQYQGPR